MTPKHHAGNSMTGNVLCNNAMDGDLIYDLRGQTICVTCDECLRMMLAMSSVDESMVKTLDPETKTL